MSARCHLQHYALRSAVLEQGLWVLERIELNLNVRACRQEEMSFHSAQRFGRGGCRGTYLVDRGLDAAMFEQVFQMLQAQRVSTPHTTPHLAL